MMLTAAIIISMFWIVLGWCWVDALIRLDANTLHKGRNYRLSFIFWPLSMMLWDAEQQEEL